MHLIHHTEAFVLKSVESGEANRRVWLFTKELGLIVATVQGVRKPGAKLRSHLIDYTLITADLVKGRDVWRLTSAQVEENPFVGTHDETSARTYVRALGLVERLCIEEGAHPDVFAHLCEVLALVRAPHPFPKLFDAVTLWKIVALFGYSEESDLFTLLMPQPLPALSETDTLTTARVVRSVTESLKHSHL